MGFRKIIAIILALLLTSGMANCICAQTNDSIANIMVIKIGRAHV